MAFAILKLSYNAPGDNSLVGGICGSGFFLDGSTAVTAHHVLNDETFKPNVGFRYVSVWIVSRNGSVLKILRACIKTPSVHLRVTPLLFRRQARLQLLEPVLDHDYVPDR